MGICLPISETLMHIGIFLVTGLGGNKNKAVNVIWLANCAKAIRAEKSEMSTTWDVYTIGPVVWYIHAF